MKRDSDVAERVIETRMRLDVNKLACEFGLASDLGYGPFLKPDTDLYLGHCKGI